MENLNDLEIRILRILEDHLGKPNAIGRFVLVDRINAEQPLVEKSRGRFRLVISEREIRRVMKHITTQHGFAIGSCHNGYFMAITAEEIEGVCKYYDGYGLSSLFVSSKLRKIEMREYLGQLSLRFENNPPPPSFSKGGQGEDLKEAL